MSSSSSSSRRLVSPAFTDSFASRLLLVLLVLLLLLPPPTTHLTMRRAATAYASLLKRYPLSTKTATGFVLSGLGDVTAQRLERVADGGEGEDGGEGGGRLRDKGKDKDKAWDARRTLTFASFGATWTGPVNHAWLPVLARMFPGAAWSQTIKRVAVQQLAWNPVAFMPAFYAAYGLGMGLSLEQTLDKARREYATALVACWQIWIPTTLVVFRFPEVYQSVAMSLMNLVWNTRLSWVSSTEARRKRRMASVGVGEHDHPAVVAHSASKSSP